jgi:hypothetical protein
LEIHERNVRTATFEHAYGFLACCSAANNFHIGLPIDQRDKPIEYYAMIVDTKNANAFRQSTGLAASLAMSGL